MSGENNCQSTSCAESFLLVGGPDSVWVNIGVSCPYLVWYVIVYKYISKKMQGVLWVYCRTTCFGVGENVYLVGVEDSRTGFSDMRKHHGTISHSPLKYQDVPSFCNHPIQLFSPVPYLVCHDTGLMQRWLTIQQHHVPVLQMPVYLQRTQYYV